MNNEKITRVVLTLENSLCESAAKGGLGELEADIFYGIKENDNEMWLFFTPLYTKIIKQENINGELITKVDEFRVPEKFRLVDSFEIKLKDETIKLEVYEHPLSRRNKKAYFLASKCFDHPIYEAGNVRNEIKTACCLSLGVAEYLRKHEITPSVLHLNESETFFLLLYLPRDENSVPSVYFHSHTAEPHGHKRFYIEDLKSSLTEEEIKKLEIAREGEVINMGKYAANTSNKIVCVSQQHAEVTKNLYPFHKDKIIFITNGVHSRWIGEEWKKLFDIEIEGWREDAKLLEKVQRISDEKIVKTKEEQMKNLEEELERKIEKNEAFGNLSPGKLILSYAKRLTDYKRPLGVFSLLDLDINIVIAGPPIDYTGKIMIEEIRKLIKLGYPIVYVLNYNAEVASQLLKGYAWLNIPYRGREASGTSFMKALINGTIPITTADGSVPEFVRDEYNGFIVSDDLSNFKDKAKTALEIYNDKSKWAKIIKNSLSTYSVIIDRVIEDIRTLK